MVANWKVPFEEAFELREGLLKTTGIFVARLWLKGNNDA